MNQTHTFAVAMSVSPLKTRSRVSSTGIKINVLCQWHVVERQKIPRSNHAISPRTSGLAHAGIRIDKTGATRRGSRAGTIKKLLALRIMQRGGGGDVAVESAAAQTVQRHQRCASGPGPITQKTIPDRPATTAGGNGHGFTFGGLENDVAVRGAL